METSELDDAYNQLKEKYWKPEWDSMSEEEKFKDLQYSTYLYKVLDGMKNTIEHMKKKSRGTEYEQAVNDLCEAYEQVMSQFTLVDEE